MKKIFGLFISSVLVISVLTACSFSANPEKGQKDNTVLSESAPSTTQEDSTPPDNASFIGEERAKEIALERAGISSDGVIFDRVELDRSDGVWQYEVEFRKDRTEYDADIKADDGTVLFFESDFDD